MPLAASLIGASSGVHRQSADSRWLMAYAASVDLCSPFCVDTTRFERVLAHPMFVACLEWAPMQKLGELDGARLLTEDERRRNVHASIDLHLVRPIVANETLETEACISAVWAKGPHAWQRLRVETRDERGEMVAVSHHTAAFLNTEIAGEPGATDEAPATPRPAASGDDWSTELIVTEATPHIYTEASRIWNPIHTDRAVALSAGLPGIILHGSATLALSVSALLRARFAGDPRCVARIGCRFRNMLPVPHRAQLGVSSFASSEIGFQVLSESKEVVLSDGFLAVRSEAQEECLDVGAANAV